MEFNASAYIFKYPQDKTQIKEIIFKRPTYFDKPFEMCTTKHKANTAHLLLNQQKERKALCFSGGGSRSKQ